MNAFPVISVGIGYQTKQLIFLFVVLYLRTGIIKIIAIYIEYSPDTFGILLCTVVCKPIFSWGVIITCKQNAKRRSWRMIIRK